MTTVLVVDDSATVRAALRSALEEDPEIRVVGEAETGSEALRLIMRRSPDIVTLDLFLRRENGLDVAAMIMSQCPRPILLVTSANAKDTELVFKAVAAGVLDVAPQLPSPWHSSYQRRRAQLLRALKTLARVPVVRRVSPRAEGMSPQWRDGAHRSASASGRYEALLIAASTGGPPAICTVLSQLTRPFGLPIVIVQHMAEGFLEGFADWLHRSTDHSVVVVDSPVEAKPDTVYLAQSERHLELSGRRTLTPSEAPPRAYQRPSADVLFESAAVELGDACIAAVLTGMGTDGGEGLLALRRKGSLTIAQDPDSCAVDSMPRHAIDLGAVDLVLPVERIASEVVRSLGSS
jgi:two-component system chemotaxis response regulator CheB